MSRRGWVLNPVAAGIVVSAGLATGAGLSPWGWGAANSGVTLEERTTVATVTTVRQHPRFEDWQIHAVRYGLVEARIESSVMEGALDWAENHALPVRLIERILPPEDAAAFNLTVFEPEVATAAPTLMQPESPSPTAPRGGSRGHPGSVLNNAQIASLKGRLNLAPSQERMWPAVEVALRKVSYVTDSSSQRHLGYINFNAPEIEELKTAAIPLILSLSEKQKRELKSLAHVMGLDAIVTPF